MGPRHYRVTSKLGLKPNTFLSRITDLTSSSSLSYMLFIFVFALFLVLRSCFLLIYRSLPRSATTFIVLGVRLSLGFSPENSTSTNIGPRPRRIQSLSGFFFGSKILSLGRLHSIGRFSNQEARLRDHIIVRNPSRAFVLQDLTLGLSALAITILESHAACWNFLLYSHP